MRNFEEWLSKLKSSISTYDYYMDLEKVIRNVDGIKIELNILNALIGSNNIENDFEIIINKYPETLKCIPILMAVRGSEVEVKDIDGSYVYNFNNRNYNCEQYKIFMRKTGLFNLLSKCLVSNLVDYVLGVETGLDSNARKNRGGHQMENLVEKYINQAGFVKGETYFKEMTTKDVKKLFNIDLSCISNEGKAIKKFDFIIKKNDIVYGIETNFYMSSGSKLNETARSYKHITNCVQNLDNFKFVWITDGKGWNKAKNNLMETFEVLDNLYNINDMENGILNVL